MLRVAGSAVFAIALGLIAEEAASVGPRDNHATALPVLRVQAESGRSEPEAAAEAEDDATAPEEAEPGAPNEADAGPEQAEDASRSGADEETGAVVEADEFTILRSPDRMPEPVRRTWQALVDTARSGNIERLRLLIDVQPSPPVFSFGEIDDPIDYLKSLSGDAAGREILAILLEILETGYMHVDRGTPQEMYLWPYFARYPLARLTPSQIVEMFTILTAGDYQDMLSYGAYIFFRVGIGPDGTWHFFVAGD